MTDFQSPQPEDERAAFEHAECDGDLTRDGEGYQNGYSEAAWRGFQTGATWARAQEAEKAAEVYGELLAAQEAVEHAQGRAAAAEGFVPEVARTQAAQDVLAERQRQISVECWTPEHDDETYRFEELAFAASCYATADEGDAPPAVWPFPWVWWKPKDRRRNLIKAAALILAEIERLDRAKANGVAA